MITKERKQSLIQEFKTHGTDSGSPEVQVAVLTERITSITGHLKDHPKDHTTRRGLLVLVGRRNKLLKYLARTHTKRYRAVIHRLGLRK